MSGQNKLTLDYFRKAFEQADAERQKESSAQTVNLSEKLPEPKEDDLPLFIKLQRGYRDRQKMEQDSD